MHWPPGGEAPLRGRIAPSRRELLPRRSSHARHARLPRLTGACTHAHRHICWRRSALGPSRREIPSPDSSRRGNSRSRRPSRPAQLAQLHPAQAHARRLPSRPAAVWRMARFSRWLATWPSWGHGTANRRQVSCYPLKLAIARHGGLVPRQLPVCGDPPTLYGALTGKSANRPAHPPSPALDPGSPDSGCSAECRRNARARCRLPSLRARNTLHRLGICGGVYRARPC